MNYLPEKKMRLTIIPSDKTIYIDGEYYSDIDMSWVPQINGIDVHAVQWYGDHGSVELVTQDPNIKINELGVWEQSVELWQKKKEEHQLWLEEQKALMEVRNFSQYEGYGDLDDLMALDYILEEEVEEVEEEIDVMAEDFDNQSLEEALESDLVNDDMNCESSKPIEVVDDQVSEEDQIYYDIEELLKEI